jgi:hypothetical protein
MRSVRRRVGLHGVTTVSAMRHSGAGRNQAGSRAQSCDALFTPIRPMLVSRSLQSGLGAQSYSLCLHAADNVSCSDEAGFLPTPVTLHYQTGDGHG